MHSVRIGHIADLVVEGIARADHLTLPKWIVLNAGGVLVTRGFSTTATMDHKLLIYYVRLRWWRHQWGHLSRASPSILSICHGDDWSILFVLVRLFLAAKLVRIALIIFITVYINDIDILFSSTEATALSIDLIVNWRFFGALFPLFLFFDCSDGHSCDLVKYLEVLRRQWTLLIVIILLITITEIILLLLVWSKLLLILLQLVTILCLSIVT